LKNFVQKPVNGWKQIALLRCAPRSQNLERATVELKSGKGPGAASAMLKLYGTEHNKSRYEILISSLGAQSLGWSGDGFSRKELGITREWLRSRANSIEGGTSEVQLNITAKRVLNLPD
jgi:alkylation response protein AidB-like acyl-CoA dehydrogenase